MTTFLKHCIFPVSVFITGACVLVVEVVAVRVLSPYFGNTIFTFSSVISVILAALSIGYYIGGKYADRNPSERRFFGIILVSSIVLLGFYFIGMVLLPILSLVLSLATGPLIASFLLFFVPSFLLGTLSPYAVKLQTIRTPEQGIGSVSGVIFFWSTLGSIFGSLIAGFVLIPHFGIDRIFVMVGIVLFILGLAPLLSLGIERKKLFKAVSTLVVFTTLIMFTAQQIDASVVYRKDGVYEKITIYDGTSEGRPARFFQQDRSTSGAMFLDTDDPATNHVYPYSKYYALYKIFTPDVSNALIIGGGAYTIPKALLAELPNATIQVSEIEPLLYELSKKYFDVPDDPRLKNSTEDGRRMLAESDITYDVIFSDVYYSLFSIPVHFTTREFFALAKEKLHEDGIFVANIIGDLSRQQPSLFFAEIKTFKSVFPNSYFFATKSSSNTDYQNIIFVGYNSDRVIDFTAESIRNNPDQTLATLYERQIDLRRFDLSPYPILTDNFSPVEYLTSKVLKRAIEQNALIDGNEMLAVVDQQRRSASLDTRTPDHDVIQEFLQAEMEELADDVVLQSFDYGRPGEDSRTHTNIIGRFYPEAKKRIILGTHYNTTSANDDGIPVSGSALGMNDSAPGVAVLIELARVLATTDTPPPIGVDIVFFDGAENDTTANGSSASEYFSQKVDGLYGENKPLSAIVLNTICDKNAQVYREQSSVERAPVLVDAFWNVAKTVDGHTFHDEVKYSISDAHTPLNAIGIPSILLTDHTNVVSGSTKDTYGKCAPQSLETTGRALYEYLYSL